jgi:hypothetical protein
MKEETCMRGKRSATLIGLVLGAILLFGAVAAFPESLRWTPAAGWTDNTGNSGSFTAAEMSTMTFYIRINQPNPRDTTGWEGWYYLGETRNGVSSYPADNSLASLMRSYGFEGKTVSFTVSQAFKDTDGVERDSAPSTALAWTVPIPFVPRTPGIPEGPTITE